MGQYLTTYAAPSASMLGATKEMRNQNSEVCTAERRDAFERRELDVEDEFHAHSASIAGVAHSASVRRGTMLANQVAFADATEPSTCL